MKAVTTIRISKDVLNHLRQLEVNVSGYINKLIMQDLLKKSYEDTTLKKVVDIAQKEERKRQILQELKLIGALRNISTRLEQMSKGCEITYHTLLKRNIELLELEYDFDYSKETKYLIKQLYKETRQAIKDHFEPYLEAKKLIKNDKQKKTKEIESL